MKRFLVVLPAVLLVAISVAWPALVLLIDAPADGPSTRASGPISGAPEVFLGTWPLLWLSLIWVFVPALIATLLGWPLGLALAQRLRLGRGRWLLALSALPVCLPGYLVFWSLWGTIRPGTSIGNALFGAGLVPELRQVTLIVGLIAWSAPFAAWTIAAWRLAAPDGAAKLRAIDGATRLVRLRAAARHDAPALVRGCAIAMLALLAECVSYDLAQVRTYGYELRTLDATGAAPRDVIALGWPSVIAAFVVVAIAALAAPRRPRAAALIIERRMRWPILLAALCAVPAILILIRGASLHEVRQFVALYAAAATNSLALALVAGAMLALAGMSLAAAWNTSTSRVVALLWLVAAATPATLVAIALEAAWNRDATAWIYDGPAIVIVGLVARFGAVAVVAASLAAASESMSTRWLRQLDAPRSLLARWRTRRPALVAAAVVAFAAGAALSFSEVAVTARVRPPMPDLLATSTLNAIHYQEQETVMLGAAVAVALGALAALVVVLMLPRARRALVVALPVAFLCSCGPEAPSSDGGVPPVPFEKAVGSPGFGKTQFHTPRAIAYAPQTHRFFVVDKEARVQRLDEDGNYELEWKMPESENGKPVGIAIHPDGRVFIADTHYYRVMVYDQDGHELARFGSYGKELGQFIYPTDIAFGEDGRLYVGEFGSNDRIQIFAPDFTPLKQFGSVGVNVGELSRPQNLVFDREHHELVVTDCNNQRIVFYDPEGNLLRQFGSAGHSAGQLCYPRGLVLLGDGTILVSEFGNHRLQRFDARPGADFGKSLGIWGGPGTDCGRLQYPWGLAGVPGRIVVLDSGHDRLLFSTLPDSAPRLVK